jgi:hypothetical protein
LRGHWQKRFLESEIQVVKNFVACVAALVVVVGVAGSTQAAEAWYDPATGNIRLVLGTYHGVVGFEAFGSLQFNAAASGNLGTVAPAQKDAKILAYFSANLLPAGDYVISSICRPFARHARWQ